MKRLRLLILFLGLTLTQLATGQTMKAYVKGAAEAMEKKDYFSAYNFLRIAYEIDSNNIETTYNLAEAARLYAAFTNAEKYYQKVADSKDADKYPATMYWLGYVKERLGKYNDALDLYTIYLSEHSDDDEELTMMANKHIEISRWAIEQLENADTTLELVHLGSEVNTAFSEFGAHQKDEDLLYYSSLRFLIPDNDENTPDKPVAKVLKSEENATGTLDSLVNDDLRHTAHTAFNAEGTRVYYTICDYINTTDIRCDIYYRDIVDGEYGLPQMLPEPINMPGVTNTQPHVGFDPVSGREVLYFVSNREGGAGKLDIWYSYIAGSENFTEPENLVGINTPFNDVSPYYHRGSNSLYFSSDGYLGFGGLDIFNASMTDGQWSEPENLGSPMNSSLDDAFFTLSNDEQEGYFSSNRLGSMYLSPEDEACCYDIYYFTKEPIEVTLKVLTFNKQTGEPLNNVTVYLTEAMVNTEMYSTGDTNEVVITINRNTSYDVLGEKFEFLPDSAKVPTYDIKESTEIVKRLYLAPAQRVLVVRTFEKRTRAPLEGVTVSLKELPDGPPRTKVDPFATQQVFLVDPNRNMQVTGSKKGYRPETKTFNSSDQPGSDTLYVDLFLELGNLEDFLPLAIYFDNDVPGRRSRAETAVVRYLETYGPYFESREEFKQKYANNLKGAERTAAEKAIDEFFDNELARGKREFESFMHILDQYLSEGLTFTIYLKGYTSPLASSDYNINLGKRRISSIQNEFKSFRDGILWKYMETGDLVVTQKSFGEETAPKSVSDDRKNLRKSIYSPEASVERRVEIIEIQK